jgi:hypothetical protein
VPESGGYWYAEEDQELLFKGQSESISVAFAHARSIYACPNCAALAVEDEGGLYRYFVPQPEPPRIFVDRSQVDALGGYGLDHPRSQQEVMEQKIILTPRLRVVVYDESGWSETCSIEPWVNPDDTVAQGRWVARTAEQASNPGSASPGVRPRPARVTATSAHDER